MKLYRVTGMNKYGELYTRFVRACSKKNARYVAQHYGMVLVSIKSTVREE